MKVVLHFDRVQMNTLHECHNSFLDHYFRGSYIEGPTFREFVELLVEVGCNALDEEFYFSGSSISEVTNAK